MLKVNVTIGPHFGYQNSFIKIEEASYPLSITLKNGTNTYKSNPFNIGVLHAYKGKPIIAQLKFQYSYDAENHVVTICGTDFESSEGMSLATKLEGTSENCIHYASTSGFKDHDIMINPHWNYHTPLMPGLQEVLRNMARAANESLIKVLEGVPKLIVQVRKSPPEMSNEDYQNLLTIYRDDQFLGLYDKNHKFKSNDVVHTIESTFGGEVTFNQNEAFANVIGSTNDPKIASMTWVALWAKQFGVYPTICTSFQFNGFPCSNTILGGHVITGKVATKVPKGANYVYIFPICVQHNNDDKVYMEALQYYKGIWLKNYLGK